jgi:hypothetical protein
MNKASRSAALIAAMLALLQAPAQGAGALAVGSTSNVTKDGIAFGTAVNHASSAAARDAALQNCLRYEPAPRAAARCRIVRTFRGECYAIAMDPQPGTPGAGWAIATDRETARLRALAQGDGRREPPQLLRGQRRQLRREQLRSGDRPESADEGDVPADRRAVLASRTSRRSRSRH